MIQHIFFAFSVQTLIFQLLGISGDIFEEGSADSHSDYDMVDAAAGTLWDGAKCVMHCSKIYKLDVIPRV